MPIGDKLLATFPQCLVPCPRSGWTSIEQGSQNCKELRWGWRLEHWMKRVNLPCFIFVYYTQRPMIHLIRHYVNSTFFLLKCTPVWLPVFSPHLREVWTQNDRDDKQQLSGEAPSGPQSPHVKKKKTVIRSSQVVPCGVADLVFQLPQHCTGV